MKKSFFICFHQCALEFHSLRVIMGYLLGAVSIFGYTIRYTNYAATLNIQLFEPFILYFVSLGNVSMALLGLFLILSDAPFVTSCTINSIYRMTRKEWCLGIRLYVIFQTMFYYGFLFIISIAASITHLYVGSVWSTPIYRMANMDTIAISRYGLSLPSIDLLSNYMPLDVFIHSFLFVVMYGTILGTILLVLNLSSNKIIGSITAFLIHFIGYVMIRDMGYRNITIKLSLLANSIFDMHSGEAGIPIMYTYALYLLIIITLSILLQFVVQVADLKTAISEKD